MLLVDTDVLVWTLRGGHAARDAIEAAADRAISAATELELVQGARDKRDLRNIERALADLALIVLPLRASIGTQAVTLLKKYRLQYGLGLGDALIAATALQQGISLLTANRKHFAPIRNLSLELFEPG